MKTNFMFYAIFAAFLLSAYSPPAFAVERPSEVKNEKITVVVVGGDAAGSRIIEQLANAGLNAEITVITAEPEDVRAENNFPVEIFKAALMSDGIDLKPDLKSDIALNRKFEFQPVKQNETPFTNAFKGFGSDCAARAKI